ncbi:hypothetical protein K7X08_035066 [Anisodus acutangulus]|uniref:Helicase ATP-binding domain-containing protein n=1 Tax=Anisodus acutangulus TaxID=402998 RepID=A0A9Q1LI25_9SOLA|nr:hypothetical protein K7X08_035066 [Anisodus acutangulus]
MLPDDVEILALCKGLILFDFDEIKVYCVFNPITGAHQLIPYPEPTTFRMIGYPGLAVEYSSSNQYKLVTISKPAEKSNLFYKFHILSSERSVLWREIQLTSYTFSDLAVGSPPVYWRDSLHWLRSDGSVLVFDTNREEAILIDRPEFINQFDKILTGRDIWLGVAQGLLNLVCIFGGPNFEGLSEPSLFVAGTAVGGIRQAGFPAPSPIQAQSWPIALLGRDIVAVAKTGSGKTLGFLLPVFILLKRRRSTPQSGPTILVLSPTRELVTQIQDEAEKFGRSSKISCTMNQVNCLYGGAPKGPQIRDLERVDIVATPGRLNDILESGRIRLDQISYLVLDEADRMLDMGFEPQIRKIVKEVPTRRQLLMIMRAAVGGFPTLWTTLFRVQTALSMAFQS